MLVGHPSIGDGAQLRQDRRDFGTRDHRIDQAFARCLAVRVTERLAGRPGKREVIEADPGVLADLEDDQAKIEISLASTSGATA